MEIAICPMDKTFVLFRCIHPGPLSPSNIDKMSRDAPDSLKAQFDRNKRFLGRLIDTYRSCAILAMKGDSVVAHARFYPQAVYDLAGKTNICCQELGFAPTQEMVEMDLPEIEEISKRILRIQCWHVHKDYCGRGLSHRLLEGTLEWAKSHDWEVVKASAGIDDYWVSYHSCAPMLRTYMKHGFQQIRTTHSPELEKFLIKFKEGEFGIEDQRGFEKSCAGKDLSELAVYHEVEYRL